MALTTIAECKHFRDIHSDNTEHDLELGRLIPAVQSFLERECVRSFDQSTVTEYADGDEWRDRLLLARPPIVSITNIWDDTTRVFATPLAATAYDIKDAEAGLVRLLDGLCFSQGQRNIKITYLGGYSSATLPRDLVEAAIEMVWAAREKGVNNLVGVRSRSVADGNIQWVNLDWGSVNLQPIIVKYGLRTGLA